MILIELRLLLGLLNFVIFVICFGRVFLRCLIDFIKGFFKFYYFWLKIKKEVWLDIKVWLLFIENFNNKLVFKDDIFIFFDYLKLYIDVFGFLGFVGVLGLKWFVNEWFVIMSYL